ncbi:MAG: hypothetical protein WA865_12500 [Spirulinaceae cyanobacterium]
MEFVNTKQAAKILKVTPRRVVYLLQQKRITGAYKIKRAWAIPLYKGKPKISRGKRGPTPRWGKPRSAVTMIQVFRQKIDGNKKDNTFNPVISVDRHDLNRCGHEAKIKGPCRIIYSPHKSNKHGARLWIETYSEVDVFDWSTTLPIDKSLVKSPL